MDKRQIIYPDFIELNEKTYNKMYKYCPYCNKDSRFCFEEEEYYVIIKCVDCKNIWVERNRDD